MNVNEARHWIERYAAGVDDELQMDRVIEALLDGCAGEVEAVVGAGHDAALGVVARMDQMVGIGLPVGIATVGTWAKSLRGYLTHPPAGVVDEAMADLEAALDKEWSYSAELKQQLAAAREDVARMAVLRQYFKPKFHRITSDYTIMDGEVATPAIFLGEEYVPMTLDSLADAIATLQRDRQP